MGKGERIVSDRHFKICVNCHTQHFGGPDLEDCNGEHLSDAPEKRCDFCGDEGVACTICGAATALMKRAMRSHKFEEVTKQAAVKYGDEPFVVLTQEAYLAFTGGGPVAEQLKRIADLMKFYIVNELEYNDEKHGVPK